MTEKKENENGTHKKRRSILKSNDSMGPDDDLSEEATTSSPLHQRSRNSFTKTATFDELNIKETLHPADKDYGHMKIDEPKTPYHYGEDEAQPLPLNAIQLMAKLEAAGNGSPPKVMQDIKEGNEEGDETDEQKEKRLFEERRKKHYNEYDAMILARKLLDEDEDDDDEEGHDFPTDDVDDEDVEVEEEEVQNDEVENEEDDSNSSNCIPTLKCRSGGVANKNSKPNTPK